MHLLCGQCGETTTVADTLAGGTLPCPRCQRRLVLPPATSPPEPDGFADLVRQTVNKKVHVECTVCHKSFSLGGRLWGTTVKCPTCSAPLRVPHPDDHREDEFVPRRNRGPVGEPPPFAAPPPDMSLSASPDEAVSDFSFASIAPDESAPIPAGVSVDTVGSLSGSIAKLAGELASLPEASSFSELSASFAELSAQSDFSQLSDQLRFDDNPATVPAPVPRRHPKASVPRPRQPMPTELSPAPAEPVPATVEAHAQANVAVPADGGAAVAAVATVKAMDPEPVAVATPSPKTHKKRPAKPSGTPAPAQPPTNTTARRRGMPVWVFYGIIAVLAAGVAVLTPRLLSSLSSRGPETVNAPDNAPNVATLDGANIANTSPPDTGGTPSGYEGETPSPRETPSPPGHRLTVEAVRRDGFLANGYLAAPLGRVFLKLRVDVQAGREELTLSPTSAAVTGTGGPFACLGLEPPAGRLPARPAATPQNAPPLAPGEKRSLVLVFDVPKEFDGGRLDWPGTGSAAVHIVQLIPAGDWEGQWGELPPRNLRPLPSDPMQANLQRATNLKLTLRSVIDEYEVTLSPLNLQARAVATEQGDLRVEFRRDNLVLPVTLRLVDNAKILVLYLADEPMRHIAFGRE